ncbi:unnamed protein product [Symbiodinium sp. CCMP2592]|nr:unnamed protein product [Symbiodinium sp. CCMP2592]
MPRRARRFLLLLVVVTLTCGPWSLCVVPAGVGARPKNRHLSPYERLLVNIMKDAGLQGRWSEVQRYWEGYNGTAPEVYDAAMEAAYSCGQYAHGATIFKKRFNDTAEVDLNFLLTGLRLFRKLRDRLQAEAVWQEIDTKGWAKDVDVTTRLQASVLLGNISLAASALDVIRQQRILPDRFHCSAAIRACTTSDQKGRHAAASYFLDYMVQENMQPDTFTLLNALTAHRTASPQEIDRVLEKMALARIEPDATMTEAYMGAMFEGRLRRNVTSPEDVAKSLAGVSPERLQAAQSYLEEHLAVPGSRTKLTKLVKLVMNFYGIG